MYSSEYSSVCGLARALGSGSALVTGTRTSPRQARAVTVRVHGAMAELVSLAVGRGG